MIRRFLGATLLALVATLAAGLVAVQPAQAACVDRPATPYKSVNVAVVTYVTNTCNSATHFVLQRHRAWGWSRLASTSVPSGAHRSLSWICEGVGTYTYRAYNELPIGGGSLPILHLSGEGRFSC